MNAPTYPEVNIGERSFIRGMLGENVSFQVVVKGEVGSSEIRKLIKLLEAQAQVLDVDEKHI